MDFLKPNFFPFGYLLIFAAILLLGLIGGELTKKSRFIPTITGYIVVGFLVGPGGFNLINDIVLAESRIFIEISIGLILFEIGRQLDFSWLKYEPSLLWMSIAESSLTFFIVTILMHVLGMSWITSLIAGSIAITTSPAVIMMVAYDLNSEGPVTRRSLLLTSLNNFFGLCAFLGLLPFTTDASPRPALLLQYYTIKLLLPCLLGLLMFLIAKLIAMIVGKRKETQFVLFVSMTLLTISIARMFNLSMMLSLFIFGVATRNLDIKHSLIEINFNFLARMAFILLFVMTGVQLQLNGLWIATASVLAFILGRFLAKTLGVWLFSFSGRLTSQQTWAISFALTPMAGIALGLSFKITDFNQALSLQLTTIIGAVVAILQILGPIATQYAFMSTGEAVSPSRIRET